MNILLAYPEFPDTFWSYSNILKMVRKGAVSPPLGLLTVGAMLPREWHLRLVDLAIAPLSRRDLEWADYVFISAMSVQQASSRRLIAQCRAAGKKTVCGGPLFTSSPASFADVDHLVLNEAELTLPPFLEDLARGEAKRVYRSNAFADLRQSPVPAWGLADLRQYTCMSVQFSRGCPFNCDFCNVTSLLGRQPRTKTGAQVVSELNALQQAGWRGPVFFVDDNLIGDRRAARTDLLPALIRWQKDRGPTPLLTQASINLADDQRVLPLMTRAGFDTVFVGIETPDVGSLAECGKSQNTDRDLAADVRRLQKAGLEVQGGFIVGFDHDTPEIFQRQAEFIQRSGIVTAMVGLLQAPIGTELHSRLQREGRLSGSWSGDNANGTTNIIPRMGMDTLRAGYEKLLNALYAPRAYYKRIRAFLREYRAPVIRAPLRLTQIQAFVRSLYHLGVVGEERLQYWRLLAWTLLRRPTLFPVAVKLAICGQHYRRMMEMHVRGTV